MQKSVWPILIVIFLLAGPSPAQEAAPGEEIARFPGGAELARNTQSGGAAPEKTKPEAESKERSAGYTHPVAVAGTPKEYKLYPIFPDSDASAISLRFDIPAAAGSSEMVELTLYNHLGQRVKTIFEGKLSAGCYQLLWPLSGENGPRLPGGAYYLTFKTEFFQEVRKLSLRD